jgi:hypothetical protein
MSSLLKKTQFEKIATYCPKHLRYSTGTDNASDKSNSITCNLNNNNLNEVGVQMIDETFRSYLFGKRKPKDVESITKAREHLKKFDLIDKNIELMQEVNKLKLPKLKGQNIDEHFENIGNQIKFKYFNMVCSFAASCLPPMPKNFNLAAGWTK